MSPPIPPPQRINSQAIDKPGHATRLVATKQPDKALHLKILARWSLCSCKAIQAFNDKAY